MQNDNLELRLNNTITQLDNHKNIVELIKIYQDLLQVPYISLISMQSKGGGGEK